MSNELSTLSKIELAGEDLTDLVNERNEFFDSQPDYWKCSSDGDKYLNLTLEIEIEISEFEELISRLQYLIYEIDNDNLK